MTVRRGAPVEAAGCTAATCAYLAVELDGFPPGQYEVDCFGAGRQFDTGSSFVPETGGELACYYGYPGDEVGVEVGGVRSGDRRW